MKLAIDPDGEATHGECPDCDHVTRSVWGYVSRDGRAHAVYFIRWTDGHLDRGAQVLVSIGTWGDAPPSERRCVGLECRVGQGVPGFMVVDAATLPWGENGFLGDRLRREMALADPMIQDVFDILDRLIVDDPRFVRFLGG